MRIHESAEDYLEQILLLEKENGSVRSIDIVHSLGYSKPSISRAVKNLRENGYIEVGNKGIITLTEKGRKIAQDIYERHELLCNCFQTLGVSKEVALRDACKVEHDLSEETFEAIKKYYEKIKS